MSAPAGNINAEKWTLGNTEWLLHQVENLVDEPGVLLLNQALCICNAYSKLWWRLKRKFCLNEDIIHRMELIEEQFENKILCGVLTGRYKEKAAKMVMERSTRYEQHESQEAIISGVPDDMIDAVQAKIGILDASMWKDTDRRRVIVHAYGKTTDQLIAEGFHFHERALYAPDEPGFIDEYGEWTPCTLAQEDECDECREAA